MTNETIYKDFPGQKELLEKISPKFAEAMPDLQQLLDASSDPKVVTALLFRLIEEREKTNRMLEQINDKYDRIMFELKTRGMEKEPELDKKTMFEILPQQDQIILEFVDKQGGSTACDVQAIMHYKGLNAASQRLNKLYKEGFLKKVQQGKKVVYIARTH